ncbi:MAG: protease modulator HflC [Burkholderiales bacterium]|jgi:membrane protease subunit HflC|nr:protease modulator HflC [Burkholderiales bacterium]
MKRNFASFVVVALVLLVVASLAMFTVDQRQSAIVLQLGEIVSVKTQPGLYVKTPLVQNVIYVDRRVRTLDTPDADLIITAEKINMLVDSFVKWRVADPRQYYVSVRADEKNAEARLLQLVRDGLRAEFNKRTVDDVVSGQRDQVMESLRANVDREARALGIQVVDVRLKRVDYSEKVADSVYEQMRQERVRVANERRSTGAAEREQIQADADKQRQIIISEAYRDAQRIKGEGDAKAAAIYAQAYSLNPEFYAFYRSLDAYKESFRNRSDVLVLDPNSEFFKYFRNPGRGTK